MARRKNRTKTRGRVRERAVTVHQAGWVMREDGNVVLTLECYDRKGRPVRMHFLPFDVKIDPKESAHATS